MGRVIPSARHRVDRPARGLNRPVTATQATTATTMVTFSTRRSLRRCVSPSGTSLFANRSLTCDALRFYSLSVLHPHSPPPHPTSHVRPPTTLFCIHPGAGTEKSVLVHSTLERGSSRSYLIVDLLQNNDDTEVESSSKQPAAKVVIVPVVRPLPLVSLAPEPTELL